ncbi:hypothetical protein GQ44DRAFT_696742 [Phaeosphaeriaceae sp. PMI808]|nr:hypothetical protein GQ44DRAFT_696742 [Phaeosphaeriaceae sp. PMI808]
MDYYDIPTEWIPSSNFAGRPAGEISDSGEVSVTNKRWTFYTTSESSTSSTSSTSSSSAEDMLASKPGEYTESTPTPTQTSPQKPTIIITSPTVTMQKPLSRSLSDSAKFIRHPRAHATLARAATTPTCAPRMPDYAPQPPRRAISERIGQPDTLKARIICQESVMIELVDAKEGGPEELPGSKRWPIQRIHFQEQCYQNHYTTSKQLSRSLSQKARVRKTLHNKGLGRLNTSIKDTEPLGQLRPSSMMLTPRELYGLQEGQSPGEDPSNPHAIDARRSIISSGLVKVTSSCHHSTMKAGSILLSDKGSKRTSWMREKRMYEPGAICLEKHPAEPRRDSVATLDPFDKTIGPRNKRFSDTIMLDSITMFFEELGVVEYASEQCLDRYWDGVNRKRCHVASLRKSITSVEELPVRSLTRSLSLRSPRSSRFSFSSASSTTSQARAGTPMRDRLRRLLLPPFPGSAFLKTAGEI